MRVLSQYYVKAAAAGWRLYFAPVMFAHRCDLVGIKNRALEKIQSSKKFDTVQGEKWRRQIREVEIKAPETALVRHVMNRKHRFERQIMRAHKHRHQRCRPIMHVQNLQWRRQSPCEFQRRFAEKNEPRCVIFVGLAALAVNSLPIEKLVATNEKQLNAAGAASFQVFGDVSFVAHLHIYGHSCLLFLERAIPSNFAVIGECYADLMPARTERTWQRIHHVN